MHNTLKLGDVGNETGPRANVVKGGPLTERDFHLGTGLTTRKNTEVCLLAKAGKPKQLSVGRRCAAPEKPDAIQARPAQISKTSKVAQQPVFLRSVNNLDERKSENGAPFTLEVLDA
jgi:hypothetical protein